MRNMYSSYEPKILKGTKGKIRCAPPTVAPIIKHTLHFSHLIYVRTYTFYVCYITLWWRTTQSSGNREIRPAWKVEGKERPHSIWSQCLLEEITCFPLFPLASKILLPQCPPSKNVFLSFLKKLFWGK